MERAARDRRVYIVEEPQVDERVARPALRVVPHGPVSVVRLEVPARFHGEQKLAIEAELLDRFVARERISDPVGWYYTPMALPWSEHLPFAAVVYDCMDQLSAFRGAPREIEPLEKHLLGLADLVFTGGRQLYEAKSGLHPSVHLFPSSVDRAHFAAARATTADPGDQAAIPHPRLGYFGVIDERIDLGLVDAIAHARPRWHLVLVGPTAKIDRRDLPNATNVHLFGMRRYAELPRYLAGWDVAIMPFAHNDATRFISPTKTPEYLAGGKPVVSTSIADVVDPYGVAGLARIADGPNAFVAAVEDVLESPGLDLERVDALLATTSWDRTWQRMASLLDGALAGRRSSGEDEADQPEVTEAAERVA